VQNLRNFSRVDQAEDFAEYDLNSGVRATLAVVKDELKCDCDIKTELSELPPVPCNAGQINQVFLNILVNAAQAIKSQERGCRGHIVFRTRVIDGEVICEISDDGPGIEPDQLTKVFDPFFTTRAPGQGTGLGLSIARDIIVNKHKGKLLVESTVGKGTKFTIKLPINRQNQDRKQEAGDVLPKDAAVCG
jgi:two-component system NtrC family sensor kinase